LATFERFVGLRFLRPRRKQVFLSIITIVSVGGLAVGVATLIVVISVITGFQDYMQEKSLEAYSHMIVLSFTGQFDGYEEIEKKVAGYPGVRAASPFVYSEVMISFKDNVSGVVLRGIEPDKFRRVSMIEKHMDQGDFADLSTTHPASSDSPDAADQKKVFPGLVIGSELAASLHVFPGDVVNVITPLGESTPMGIVPKMRRFVVVGLFTLGLYEFDSKFAFIDKKEAQDFFGIGDKITGIEISLEDIWKAPDLAYKMNNELGWPFKVKDWTKMNENLFSAIKLEKLVMFLILCIIIFVASMNVFTALYMMVKDKNRSIAVLRSMGASPGSIRRIFLVEGSFIGIVGSVLGLLLGTGVCLAQIHFKLVRIDPKVYLIDTLPMKLEVSNFLLISAAAMGMALLATWIPAILASRVDPVKVLRYE
jgi:lipoprotein-releasing system permease protein